MADIEFYFDPVCPYAWMTSRWVHEVAAQREYDVEWRFISLRVLNLDRDYDSRNHEAGMRLLRVAARIRAEHGAEAVGPFYTAVSSQIFDVPVNKGDKPAIGLATPERLGPLLAEIGLPTGLTEALDDDSWDDELKRETAYALSLTGDGVGTPIIAFDPPDGVAFFGPVISAVPAPDRALELWDHVIGLARFPAFAELKRSLRQRPQLVAFGADPRSTTHRHESGHR